MLGVSATKLTGSDNTAVGNGALFSIQGAAPAKHRYRYEALYDNTTGVANIAGRPFGAPQQHHRSNSTPMGLQSLFSATEQPERRLRLSGRIVHLDRRQQRRPRLRGDAGVFREHALTGTNNNTCDWIFRALNTARRPERMRWDRTPGTKYHHDRRHNVTLATQFDAGR